MLTVKDLAIYIMADSVDAKFIYILNSILNLILFCFIYSDFNCFLSLIRIFVVELYDFFNVDSHFCHSLFCFFILFSVVFYAHEFWGYSTFLHYDANYYFISM